nr:hypothetical protein [Tanacetum cinerariifolium]
MAVSCEGDSALKLGLSDYSFTSMSDMNPFVYSHKFEGSTSAKRSGGYMPSLLLALCMQMHNLMEPGENSYHETQISSELSAMSDYSLGTSSDHQTSNSKKCKFEGCTKGCSKGAESRTAYCKAHGGGRRCQYLGCTKSAEGRTEHCIAHVVEEGAATSLDVLKLLGENRDSN